MAVRFPTAAEKAEIISRLSVEDIYGDRDWHRSGSGLRAPRHPGGSRDAFSVDPKTMAWFDFAEGRGGGPVQWIIQEQGGDDRDAWAQMAQRAGICLGNYSPSARRQPARTPPPPNATLPPMIPAGPAPVRDIGAILGDGLGLAAKESVPYLRHRFPGVADIDLELAIAEDKLLLSPVHAQDRGEPGGIYELGRAGYALGSPLYSIEEPGVVSSAQMRWVGIGPDNPPPGPKTRSLSGSPGGRFGATFGRLDQALEAARLYGRLVIAEGDIDFLTVRLSSIPYSVGINGVGRAAHVLRYLISISWKGRLILALDNDDAGRGAIENCRRILVDAGEKGDGIELAAAVPQADKDINDLFRRAGGGCPGAKAVHELIECAEVVRAAGAWKAEAEARRVQSAEAERVIRAALAAQADERQPSIAAQVSAKAITEGPHPRPATTPNATPRASKILEIQAGKRLRSFPFALRHFLENQRTNPDGTFRTDTASRKLHDLANCGVFRHDYYLDEDGRKLRSVAVPCELCACGFCGGTYCVRQADYQRSHSFWPERLAVVHVHVPEEGCEGRYGDVERLWKSANKALAKAGIGDARAFFHPAAHPSVANDLNQLGHSFDRSGLVLTIELSDGVLEMLRAAFPNAMISDLDQHDALELVGLSQLVLPLTLRALADARGNVIDHPWLAPLRLRTIRHRGACQRMPWLALKKWKNFTRTTDVDERPQTIRSVHAPSGLVLAEHSSEDSPLRLHELMAIAARNRQVLDWERADASGQLGSAADRLHEAREAAFRGRSRRRGRVAASTA
jgi:hypothetical protein